MCSSDLFIVEVSSIHSDLYEKIFNFRILNNRSYELMYYQNGEEKKLKGNFDKELITTDFIFKIRSNGLVSDIGKLNNILYQFTVHSKENLISGIRNNLNIENPEYTQILKITLKDVLWERGIIILDTLFQVYARSKLITKLELNDRTVDYIDRQLSEITESLRTIEDTLQGFKERQSIIDLEWEKNDVFSKISMYDKMHSDLNLELNALKDLENYIIQDKDPSFLPPSMYVFEKTRGLCPE